MCKRRQITHKLNKEGLYIKFVRDSLVLYTSIKLKKKKKKKKEIHSDNFSHIRFYVKDSKIIQHKHCQGRRHFEDVTICYLLIFI